MKKFLLMSIILLGLFLAPNATAVTLDADVVVNVGLLTPQTGGLSAYTKGFEQAAELAITHLNDMTEFDGYNFSLTKYDTKTDAAAASAAMTAAVTDKVAYVVGAAGSSNTLAAAAVAVENKVPMISYASTSPELTTFNDHAVEGDAGYLWRTPPSDSLQGQVLSDIAVSGGFTTMVIVTLDNAYGSGLAAATKENFEKTDGNKVLKTIAYAETQIDFATIVGQIKAEEPDVVVAISYATDGSLLFVEMNTQAVNVAVIGADGVADVGIFKETTGTQEAMQGMVMVKPSAVESTSVDKFKKDYAAAFSNTTGDIYTGETYDAVMAGAYAVKAAASVVGSDIIAKLGAVKFDGATGSISFDENGDSSAGFYLVSEVVEDKMVAVATWNPVDGLTFTDAEFQGRLSDKASTPFPFVSFFLAFAAIAVVAIRKRKN